MTIKILSWNVNGIRACIKRGFFKWLYKSKPDILCLQETKINKHESSDERDLRNECYSLWKRLDPVSDAVSELKIIKFKAKTLWGEEAVQVVDALIKKAFELRTAQNLYCHLKFDDLKRRPYGEKADRELFEKYRDIVYYIGKDDKYGEEVENNILEIEEKFRPFLKSKTKEKLEWFLNN